MLALLTTTEVVTVLGASLASTLGLVVKMAIDLRKLKNELTLGEADIEFRKSESQSTTAAAAETVLNMSIKQLESATNRLDRAEIELASSRQSVKRLHERLDSLQTHVEQIEDMLRQQGIEPPPRPSEATQPTPSAGTPVVIQQPL